MSKINLRLDRDEDTGDWIVELHDRATDKILADWTGYLACARAYTDLVLAQTHAARLGARVIEVTGWRVQPERRIPHE